MAAVPWPWQFGTDDGFYDEQLPEEAATWDDPTADDDLFLFPKADLPVTQISSAADAVDAVDAVSGTASATPLCVAERVPKRGQKRIRQDPPVLCDPDEGASLYNTKWQRVDDGGLDVPDCRLVDMLRDAVVDAEKDSLLDALLDALQKHCAFLAKLRNPQVKLTARTAKAEEVAAVILKACPVERHLQTYAVLLPYLLSRKPNVFVMPKSLRTDVLERDQRIISLTLKKMALQMTASVKRTDDECEAAVRALSPEKTSASQERMILYMQLTFFSRRVLRMSCHHKERGNSEKAKQLSDKYTALLSLSSQMFL